MHDREKVIKGLECCKRRDCNNCPYDNKCPNDMYLNGLIDDALALLKEQEAVEPITQSSVYDPDTWFYVCGSCKKSVIDRGDKFCRWCGKPVLWEGR